MGADERYEPSELFVYVNGDRWELGEVKRENNTGDGCFCWYSRGDTAANTPTRCMHKLANAGWTHIEGKLEAYERVIAAIADELGKLDTFRDLDAITEKHALRRVVGMFREAGWEG